MIRAQRSPVRDGDRCEQLVDNARDRLVQMARRSGDEAERSVRQQLCCRVRCMLRCLSDGCHHDVERHCINSVRHAQIANEIVVERPIDKAVQAEESAIHALLA